MESAPIQFLHVNHVNVLVEGFGESVAHFSNLYGAQFIRDLPAEEHHACLLVIGTVIIELFAPEDFFLHRRYGPHHLGLEYQVPDMDEARSAFRARGARIVRDGGTYFYTHPGDSFGISFEIYGRNFHTEGTGKPYLEPIKPLEYWRDRHPLGCTGLKGYRLAVSDLEAATAFFTDFAGATVSSEAVRPKTASRAVSLTLAETTVDIVTPTGDGPLQQYLLRHGDGICSTIFSVRDIQQATDYFAERDILTTPGDTEGSIAIPPERNRGILFEFAES